MTNVPNNPSPALFDAHNHLHDRRLAERLPEVIAAMRDAGIRHCVVNGTCESDWPEVARIAEAHPDFILPAFGLHPWHAAGRSPRWLEDLAAYLDRFPRASIGECGLDRSRRCTVPLAEQQDIFASQLRLAAERSLPVSIHCVQAWGALLDALTTTAPPDCGFLLHSYSGSPELAARLAPLGAYFSFSARSLHQPAGKLATLLRAIPPERILVETDAPDLPPPASLTRHPLSSPDGTPLNHPANLPAIADALAEAAGIPDEQFRALASENFHRFLGFSSPTPPN